MLKIAIIDDEKQECQNIRNHVTSILQATHVDYEIDCYEHTNIESHYDILFLDIDMPHEDGISFAKRYIKNYETMIVFITNRDDMVYHVFSVRPYAFIQKKHIKKDLEHTIHYLISEYNKNHQTLTLQNQNKIIHLYLRDILYIESKAHYIYIYTQDDTYKYRAKLNDMMKLLDNEFFCRVHQSYCINFYYVKKMNHEDIIINSHIIPLSRKFRDDVFQKYRQFIARRI